MVWSLEPPRDQDGIAPECAKELEPHTRQRSADLLSQLQSLSRDLKSMQANLSELSTIMTATTAATATPEIEHYTATGLIGLSAHLSNP